jgi:CBS domain-containing protein
MRELELDEVAGRSVDEVMIRRPKSLASDASVADARRVFENPKVLVCPVLDGEGRLLGELDREQLPEWAAGDEPIGGYTVPAVSIASGSSIEQAIERLTELGGDRLTVVDASGHMAGLLCLNRSHGRFCIGSG